MIGYEILNEKKANRARFLRHAMKYAWQFIFICFIFQCLSLGVFLRYLLAGPICWSFIQCSILLSFSSSFLTFPAYAFFVCAFIPLFALLPYAKPTKSHFYLFAFYCLVFGVWNIRIGSLACSAFTCIHMWKTNNMTPQYFHKFFLFSFFFFHLVVLSQFADSFFYRLIFSACVTKSVCASVCPFVSLSYMNGTEIFLVEYSFLAATYNISQRARHKTDKRWDGFARGGGGGWQRKTLQSKKHLNEENGQKSWKKKCSDIIEIFIWAAWAACV